MIYSIGHSTRPIEEFIELLTRNRIVRLADIRSMPRSRRHPQFDGEALAASLAAAGIAYRHFRALGGMRKPRRDSINTAWRHESFRGYADHMQTPAFGQALDDLLSWAAQADEEASGARSGAGGLGTAIMCAEAVWWRCHRQLTSDALVARGVEVRHILSLEAPKRHELTNFARVEAGRVTYPGLI
jgi:uncharacterized protein (DUF488 family)